MTILGWILPGNSRLFWFASDMAAVVLATFWSQALGIMFYVGSVGVGSIVSCQLEPDNPFDGDAVGLFAGASVWGHLARVLCFETQESISCCSLACTSPFGISSCPQIIGGFTVASRSHTKQTIHATCALHYLAMRAGHSLAREEEIHAQLHDVVKTWWK